MPFGTTQDPRIAAANANESKRNGALAKITVAQAHIMRSIETGKLTPSELAKLTGALVESEKLKRVIKGQPANTSQSIRESKPSKASKAPLQPLDSLPES